MSTRPITEHDLHAYVDDALDAVRREDVSAYLGEHPDVAARVEDFRAQRIHLHGALDPIADEPIPTSLNLAEMIAARRRKTASPWRMAVAAVLLLTAGGAGGWLLRGFGQSPSEGILALAQEASNSYNTYAPDRVRPVELRADSADELVGWATQSIGQKPVLPDLSKSGYRLMGGRIVSTPHGAGLMLMYDDDRGTRLVMLTRPMAVQQNGAMTPHAEGDVDGWSWASNGMGYSLVGPLPSDVLHPLADDIRKQVAASI